jgi:hypothetical protein
MSDRVIKYVTCKGEKIPTIIDEVDASFFKDTWTAAVSKVKGEKRK